MRFGQAPGGGGALGTAHTGVLINTPELLLRPEVDTIGTADSHLLDERIKVGRRAARSEEETLACWASQLDTT